MKLVGLTGGIGSGKTTVLQAFQSLGVPCFVADTEAAALYNDPLFLEQIRPLFPNSVFLPDGNADKKAIADIVFHNKAKLQQLNDIVHPQVMQHFRHWAASQHAPYVIFESAIIFEHQLQQHLDAVITVYLEMQERIRRIQLRDNISTQAIQARILNQLSDEVKMDLADYVILNYEGNPRLRQVQHIHNLLLKT